MEETTASVSSSSISYFKELLGDRCSVEQSIREAYGHDETEDLVFPPDVVVFPETVEEVSAIAKHCNDNHIPLTAIGARTGLSGGSLSVRKGVGLCLERMNKILDIDTNNFQVTTEPGVITQVLQEEVAKHNMYYAPDPASRGSCFIGGNIAENSGGPHAVKYGVTSDFVLNLEVVLADGSVIWTGANTLKNSTGYNLTQLIVGSEGTLGIVTKAVLKLIPLPRKNILMLVPFHKAAEACEAVPQFFMAGVVPSAMEFMERDAIDWTLDFVGDTSIHVSDEVQAHLLIELDGNDDAVLMQDAEKVLSILENYSTDEVLFADSEAQKDALWNLRRKVGEAVKTNSVYKEEDTVVPRYELPKLLHGVKEIGQKYGFKSVCYGHVGDGNLHVNIIKGDLTDHQWEKELPQAIHEIFELTTSLGGTLSGEHGIGWVQKNYMHIPFSRIELGLMKSIKQVFDPNNILNPSKIFPDDI